MGFVLYRRRVKSHFVILTSYCACVDLRRIYAIHIRRNCVVRVKPRWFTVLLYLEARKLILFIHNGNLISLDANR